MEDLKRGLTYGLIAAMLMANSTWAAESSDSEVGSEDVPWVVADDDIEEPVVVIPDTEEELEAAAKGVTTRGVIDDQLSILVDGQRVYIDAMKEMVNSLPVRSTGCDRDDLMAANSMLMLGAFTMAPALGVMGAGIGGGVGMYLGSTAGAVATSPSGPGAIAGAAAGAGTATAIGAAIGGGAGLAVGGAQVALVGFYVANNVQHVVNTTDSNCTPRNVTTRGDKPSVETTEFPTDIDDADFWVDFAEDAEPGVTERAARTAASTSKTRMRQRPSTRTSRYAGDYESLFIHLVKASYASSLVDLQRRWDQSRYVMSAAKPVLRNPLVRRKLKPSIDLLAYIKVNGRLPDGKPAKPLNGAAKFAYDMLTGNTAGMRDQWLRAMGMGYSTIEVGSNRATWKTPPALRLVGLQPTVSASIRPVTLNAAGLLQARVSPGPFKLSLGKPSISGNKVKVSYKIRRGSRIAAFRLSHKTLTGGWNSFFNNGAKASRDITGSVYYKFTNAGPTIDSVSFGGASVSMPSFPTPQVPGIGGAVNDIRSKVNSQARRFGAKAVPIANLLGKAADAGKKNLLKQLNKQASNYGFSKIDRIASIAIVNGALQIKIGGYKNDVKLPRIPSSSALKTALSKYEAQLRAKKPNPRQRRSRR